MSMVKMPDYFHYIINSLCIVMKLAGVTCKLDRFLEILQIVQRNLQKLARLADWTEQIYSQQSAFNVWSGRSSHRQRS